MLLAGLGARDLRVQQGLLGHDEAIDGAGQAHPLVVEALHGIARGGGARLARAGHGVGLAGRGEGSSCSWEING